MNRRHAAKIAQLTATVRHLTALQAPVTVLAIEGRRAHGDVTAAGDRGFTVRDSYGDLHTFEYAELVSVGTYNA